MKNDLVYRKRMLAKGVARSVKYHHDGYYRRITEGSIESWLKYKIRMVTRTRAKSISLGQLMLIWEKQQGRCALTGIPMTTKMHNLCSASIDRKDNSVDYTPDNVQLTCLAFNLAKNVLSDVRIRAFIETFCVGSDLVASGFNRLYVLLGRTKLSDHPNNLDLVFLKSLWAAQNGSCAITGIPMSSIAHDPCRVSLDRIDSEQGYLKGNVQLVCKAINLAKNDFPNEDIKNLVQQVREHYAIRTTSSERHDHRGHLSTPTNAE
jgi:hypothetical protein